MCRVSLVLGIAATAVLLAGCPPTYPKCENDEHCTERGEVCVQGQCQECSIDAHCKPNFVCDKASLKCVPKPECTPTGNECGEGKECRAGKCVVKQCDQNADCAAGNRCENNRCVPGCTADEDCPSGQACRDGVCQTAVDDTASCTWEPVHFDFNEAQLTSEAQQRLSQLAKCISDQSGTVTLAGHADERGTEEYNLQLSQRRAESVRRYLETLGVRPNKLDTVGYGENRPVAQGTSEDAYAQNRRVEFNR